MAKMGLVKTLLLALGLFASMHEAVASDAKEQQQSLVDDAATENDYLPINPLRRDSILSRGFRSSSYHRGLEASSEDPDAESEEESSDENTDRDGEGEEGTSDESSDEESSGSDEDTTGPSISDTANVIDYKDSEEAPSGDTEPHNLVDEASSGDSSQSTSFLGGLLKSFHGTDVCGIDFTALQKSMELILSRNGNVQVTAWEALIDQSMDKEECHDNHHLQFVLALDHFNACSGWNLQNLIEMIPSALSGSLIRCANHFVNGGDEEALVDCVRPLLLDNPVGDAIKGIYFHADQFCSCLKPFSDKVPSCRLDSWPVPLVGSWMQKLSCLVDEFWCGKIDDFCTNELRVLDQCLPKEKEFGSCEGPLECEQLHNSFSLSVPKFFRGIPLPDACSRVYGSAGNTTFEGTNIIKRYEKYQGICNEESKESKINWKKTLLVDPNRKKPVAPANTYDNESSQQQSNYDLFDSSSKNGQESSDKANLLSSETYRNGFKTGIISGSSICLVLGLSLVVYGKIRKHDQEEMDRGSYRTVEMTDL